MSPVDQHAHRERHRHHVEQREIHHPLGVATALFGVAAGSAAAAFVITKLMNLSFTWIPGPSVMAAIGAVAATIALGLIGTFRALGQKPAPVLRNL